MQTLALATYLAAFAVAALLALGAAWATLTGPHLRRCYQRTRRAYVGRVLVAWAWAASGAGLAAAAALVALANPTSASAAQLQPTMAAGVAVLALVALGAALVWHGKAAQGLPRYLRAR